MNGRKAIWSHPAHYLHLKPRSKKAELYVVVQNLYIEHVSHNLVPSGSVDIYKVTAGYYPSKKEGDYFVFCGSACDREWFLASGCLYALQCRDIANLASEVGANGYESLQPFMKDVRTSFRSSNGYPPNGERIAWFLWKRGKITHSDYGKRARVVSNCEF